MFIEQVLQAKGAEVVAIDEDATVAQALADLRQHNIGALVVGPPDAVPAGVVSERDVVRALSERGPACLEEPVSALMSRDVFTVDPHATVEQIMVLMTEHRIRHVPVVDGERMVGIVSIGDVVKHRLAELETERHQLVDYITTGR